MEPCFELRGVTVELGGQTIIKRADASIERGELLSMVGPSGAGKSTLLRCLDRLTEITSGEIDFMGEPLRKMDPLVLRKKVGMVFQLPVMFEGTVADNVNFAASIGGPEADVDGLLSKVGLETSFALKNASTLSVGEQQRVCLARTLANGPEVLLLDEPTASLDPANTRLIEDLALKLKAEGITIVLVSHNMSQARRLADRVLLVRSGETVGTYPSEEFFRERGEAGV
ncbi:MAG: phosphate ABC transporter ATP-binding protein [Methanomassiliicoccales archaeon]|nr:phosphate ABC transporter ATP-binding protein [Methanomassiliicoccales archaeon]